jgi:hypothetical protein
MTDYAERFRYMRELGAKRDRENTLLQYVRAGELDAVDPSAFSDLFPKPVVANFINNAAEDFANSVSNLPTLACSVGAMRTDTDKKKASKKNKAGHNYWTESNLPRLMAKAADDFDTYSAVPFYIECDYDRQMPLIYPESPIGAYWLKDRLGCVTHYAKCWHETVGELVAKFPELESKIRGADSIFGAKRDNDRERLEVVRYCDKDEIILFLPSRQDTVLLRYPNPIGRAPVAIAERYTQRSRYADAIWPQLARNRMRMYAIEAAEKSVHSPLVVPRDVSKIPVGPDAVIQTDGRVGRVPLDVPPAVFTIEEQMQEEVFTASRHPKVRAGESDASVITGRGVQALLGEFDAQIKAAQMELGGALREATSIAFQMDQAWFPNVTRTIHGTLSGESYQETFTPAKDIAGNYECDVTYGFAAGLTPAQATVLMLQLRNDMLISRDTFRRNSPIEVDLEVEQIHVDQEEMRDSIKRGIDALSQAIPALIQQGMDPTTIITAMSEFIRLRGDGLSVEDAAAKAFAPKPEPESPAEDQAEGGQEEGQGNPLAPQQEQQDQGPPSLLSLVAGLRNGNPIVSSSVQRRVPIQ